VLVSHSALGKWQRREQSCDAVEVARAVVRRSRTPEQMLTYDGPTVDALGRSNPGSRTAGPRSGPSDNVDTEGFVRGGMATEITVEGMTCQGCEEVVESALQMASGVEDADADRYEDVATVEGDADVDELVQKVELAGYTGSA